MNQAKPALLNKVIRRIKAEIIAFVEAFVVFFPLPTTGNWLRKKYWSMACNLGKSPFINFGARFYGAELMEIKDHFMMGDYAVLDACDSKGMFLGNYVGIGRGVLVRGANHRYDSLDIPSIIQGHEHKVVSYNGKEYSIVIEDDVYIGANSIVLTGAMIGKGSVIGAGVVLSGVIPPYSIVMGNPGRVIGSRLKKAEKGGGGA